jgi:hypothetical protein
MIKVSDYTEETSSSESNIIKTLLSALQEKNKPSNPSPTPSQKQERPQCRNCGRTGHWAAECRSRSQNPVQCTWCGFKGHLEKDCRKKQQGPRNNTPQTNNQQTAQQDRRKCFNCGREGHIQARCPNRRHDTNALGEDLQEPPTINDLFKELQQEPELLVQEEETTRRKFQNITAIGITSNPTALHAYLTIEGQQYKTLIDTGASISLMSQEVLQDIGKQVQEADTTSAMTADRTMTDIIGLVHKVKIQLADLTVPFTFRVMGKTSYPVILGWDFLRQVKSVVVADRMILQATQNEQQVEIPLFDTTQSSPEDPSLSTQPYYAEDAEFEEINAITTIRFQDLGQYLFGREYDVTYQAIAGHHCKYCRERAYDHHQHYLLFPNQESASLPLP